jgi:hypothetical protein
MRRLIGLAACSSLAWGSPAQHAPRTDAPRPHHTTHTPGSSVPAEQQRESEQAARAHSEHTQQQQQQQQQQRVLTCREGEVFYFSYGANLSLSTLKRRAVAPTSRSPAFVRDPAVRLVFKHRGGYSTLQQLDAQAAQQGRYRPYMEHVHGVVYALTTADLQALAKKEGGYQVVDIQVRGASSGLCDVCTRRSGRRACCAACVLLC